MSAVFENLHQDVNNNANRNLKLNSANSGCRFTTTAVSDSDSLLVQLDATKTGGRQFEALIGEINKLRRDTHDFLERSTSFSPAEVNVLTLSKSRLVIEVKLKEEAPCDDVNVDLLQLTQAEISFPLQYLSFDDNVQDDSGDECLLNVNTKNKLNTTKTNANTNVDIGQGDLASTEEASDARGVAGRIRRTVSESCDDVLPRRGILKHPRDAVRRTLSESNADHYSTTDLGEEEEEGSSDLSHNEGSSGDENNRPKKSVHFNDRIFTTTFRQSSSIIGRKNKNKKRAIKRTNSKDSVDTANSDDQEEEEVKVEEKDAQTIKDQKVRSRNRRSRKNTV